VVENAADKNWDREQDGRDAQRVTGSVYGMLVAGGVLRDPLLVGAVAQHVERIHRNAISLFWADRLTV